MSDKIDASCTRDIVCPYCGYEFEDSWECGEDGFVECPNSLCGKRFSFYSDHTTYYWSQRDCTLNRKEHEWVVKLELHEATMKVCTNCDQITFEKKEPDTTGDLFAVCREEA